MDGREDALCLEILQQQFDSISRTDKLFVSPSKTVFQAKLHKKSFLSQPNVYETKYIIIT